MKRHTETVEKMEEGNLFVTYRKWSIPEKDDAESWILVDSNDDESIHLSTEQAQALYEFLKETLEA